VEVCSLTVKRELEQTEHTEPLLSDRQQFWHWREWNRRGLLACLTTCNQQKGQASQIDHLLLVVALLISAFSVVWLWRENASLRTALKRSPESLWGPQALQVGDIVPTLDTIDTRGRAARISFREAKRSVVIIFSTGCDVCEEEIPVWNRLATWALSSDYPVVGISIDSLAQTQQYIINKNLAFNTLIMPGKPALRAYRVVSVPVVMIVSSRNAIEWLHYGAIGTTNLSQVMSMVERDLLPDAPDRLP
jgi:peroxiredoxin